MSALPLGQSAALREFLRTDAAAERLRALRTPSIPRFLLAVLFNYAVIALTISLCVISGSWLAWLPAIIIIAARQHALLVLMHEGAHRSISKDRNLNDLLSDMLCGAPLLVSTRSYRTVHLTHHQNLNTAEDPDWCRKVDDSSERNQWLFPAQQPLWRLLANLYGHSVIYLLKSLADNQRGEPSSQAKQASSANTALADSTLINLKYLLYAVVGIVLTLTSAFGTHQAGSQHRRALCSAPRSSTTTNPNRASRVARAFFDRTPLYWSTHRPPSGGIGPFLPTAPTAQPVA